MEDFISLCISYGLDVNDNRTRYSKSPKIDVDKRAKEQQEIMRQKLCGEKSGDIVFVCEDGARVPANRMLACAGCPVLETMLMSGMRESWERELSLPEVSGNALRIILDFLFFGSFRLQREQSERKLWVDGLRVIKAAKFLLLDSLETLVWEVLLVDVLCRCAGRKVDKKNIITNCIILTAVSDFMEEYNHIPEPMGRNLGIISSALLPSLNQRWLTAIELKEMSGCAMLAWLKCVNVETSGDDRLRMDLYLRFRQVLMWCACQMYELDKAEGLINSLLPSGSGALWLIQSHIRGKPLAVSDFLRREERFSLNDLQNACLQAKLEENFLAFLNLHLLHSVLLLKVIEPLKIFTSSGLFGVLEAHTLNNCNIIGNKWPTLTWEADPNFRIQGDGTVIHKLGYQEGWARVLAPISDNSYIYEWDVVLERSYSWSPTKMKMQQTFTGRLWEERWRIGIVKVQDLENPASVHVNRTAPGFIHWKHDPQSQWTLRMTSEGTLMTTPKTPPGYGFLNNEVPFHDQQDNLSACFKSTRIKFGVSFNMLLRSCSFWLNGTPLGKAWENLPPGTYYPFISFIPGKEGQQFAAKRQKTDETDDVCNTKKVGTVQVKLLSGFNVKWF